MATILIVDDRPTNREVLTTLLGYKGHRMLQAGDGEEALAAARTEHPDLIITDILMPKMDGYEFVRQLRADAAIASTPVIFYTAKYHEEETHLLVGESGVVHHLNKPAEPETILALVDKVLGTTPRLQSPLPESFDREHLRLVTDKLARKVDELESAKRRLELLYQKASEANRLKDEFLAALSHELRTPLNVIMGWVELLRRGQVEPEELPATFDTIYRQSKIQTKIVEDLLDVSRIITGKMVLKKRQVKLASIVQVAIESLQLAAEAKALRIRLMIDDETATLVTGDPERLQQAVWNILANAVKFSHRGGSIDVNIEQTQSRAQLRVADQGEGIDPEFIGHVFARFRQEDGKITRKHGGLGLGLALARDIVELHGGTVEAKSDGKGKGATFTLSLPVLPVTSYGLPSDLSEQALLLAEGRHDLRMPSDAIPVNLVGLKVLVLDDDADARLLIATTLKRSGALVTATKSTIDALKLVFARSIDVLVCDIGMPGEDGYSFIRKVREFEVGLGRHTPAAALTGYASAEDRDRALAAGFDVHLSKPISPASLAAVMAELTHRAPSGARGENVTGPQADP